MPEYTSLALQAGPEAMRIIRERGLRPQDIRVIAGAAGGPKWLVLSSLDRLIFGSWFEDRTAPLFLVGASIGAWRFAALSQRQPVARLDRFETAYIDQRYDASSRKFVADLPYGKIPDRGDFRRFFGDDKGRIDYWRTVSRKSRQLADELAELMESNRIAEKVRPFGDQG